MSTLRRAGRNIFFKTIAEVFSRLIYLVFFIFMARKLGVGDFGLFSFAFSFAGIFAILMDPGLNILITRDVAKDKSVSQKYNDNVMGLKLALSPVTLLLIWVSLISFGYDGRTIAAALMMGIFLIMSSLLDFFIAITDAHERMDVGAGLKIINKLLISVLGGLALYSGSSLVGLINYMIAGSLISLVSGLFIINKAISRVGIKFDLHFIKNIFLSALPVGLTMIFSIIYFRIDVVMLSLFGVGNEKIGLYSAAVKFIEILNVIPAVFVGAIFPIMAGLSVKGKAELEATFKKGLQILFIIAIPLVISISALSGKVIDAVYGAGYAASADALKILIWTSLFIFPNFILTSLIVLAERQKLNALFSFSCLLFNVALNCFLIPRYGFIGAGVATVATDMIFFLCTVFFAARYFKNYNFLKDMVKPAFCGITLLIILQVIQDLNLFYTLAVSFVSYPALIIITKTITVTELRRFSSSLLESMG